MKLPEINDKINQTYDLEGDKNANLKITEISCDGGPEFKKEFKENWKQRGIKLHDFDPNKHGKTVMGIVERFNRTLKNSQKTWWQIKQGVETKL